MVPPSSFHASTVIPSIDDCELLRLPDFSKSCICIAAQKQDCRMISFELAWGALLSKIVDRRTGLTDSLILRKVRMNFGNRRDEYWNEGARISGGSWLTDFVG
jgi:hypothetical protein